MKKRKKKKFQDFGVDGFSQMTAEFFTSVPLKSINNKSLKNQQGSFIHFLRPAYPWRVVKAAARVGPSKHFGLVPQEVDGLVEFQGKTITTAQKIQKQNYCFTSNSFIFPL